MKLRLSLMATTLVLVLSAVVALPGVASAAQSKRSYAIPADGTTASGAPVTGTFNITKFKHTNGVLRAVGTFTGTVNGKQVTSRASLPITAINGTAMNGKSSNASGAAQAAASCSILDLTLGPLHLNLLGLVVDLNQVHLQITGDTGPGNLLGNLLCNLAGLLDNNPAGGLLQQITNLLNQILGQL